MADRRYRAYETIQVLRKNERKELVPTDASGDVAFEGDLPKNGVAEFDAGKTKVRRVAFYAGAMEEEVCLGSVEVNSAGKIKVSVEDIPTDEE